MSDHSAFSIYQQVKESYQGTDKQRFDRAHLLYAIFRPLSFFPTSLALKWGLSANMVTAIGGVFLIGAIAALAVGNLVLGAWLYLTAFVLDFVDGNIARFTKSASHFGGLVDGMMDSVTLFLFIALACGNIGNGTNLFDARIEWVLGIGAAIGFLYRILIYVRYTMIIKQASPSQKTTTQASARSVIGIGKKINEAVISAISVVLLAAVYTQTVSLFLLLYFVIYSIVTIAETIILLGKVKALG